MHFPRWSFGLVFRSARRMGLRVRKRTRRHVGRERGDSAEVERLWQAVVTECPGDREALAKVEHLRLIRATGTRLSRALMSIAARKMIPAGKSEVALES
jgi:hypothetical protein